VTSSSSLRVSVIVPAYNAEPYLADAVQSALEQTWRDLEVIIVDDGSTDGTRGLAEGFVRRDRRVHLITKPNGGLSSARNAGLAAATGDVICFLDADDAFLPDKLERQVAFLARFPACDLVYSDYYVGSDDLTPVWFESVRPLMSRMDEYLLYRNAFAPLCPLLRISLVAATGTFNEGLRASEDWDYWIRAAQHGRFSYLPGPVGVYRTHAGQMHHDQQLMHRSARMVADGNFPRGSRRWRAVRGARIWAEAREVGGAKRLVLMPLKLAHTALVVRSPRLLLNVIRWAA
jgi:glycosyltransferase involved in cell wall biosynthesis